MISQKKAASVERAYRGILYRRPIGIFSLLMLAGVSVFAVGIAASAAKVEFPFFSVYVSIFALLIVAIALHWLLHALALLKKKNWSGAVMALVGLAAAYFGCWLFVAAVAKFPE